MPLFASKSRRTLASGAKPTNLVPHNSRHPPAKAQCGVTAALDAVLRLVPIRYACGPARSSRKVPCSAPLPLASLSLSATTLLRQFSVAITHSDLLPRLHLGSSLRCMSTHGVLQSIESCVIS